ncbi:hypothetical protein NKH75_27280 [Mesorhizobium sp. M0984]|uniref:hypothetical protein n=1 Tax=Mesorhizobium sp. M0984 TaxID=2957041 RepID=UPI00333DE1A4
MSAFFRRRVEATIEHMIGLLDQMEGDPDLEPETIEEQHDREAADTSFVLAERSRRKRLYN